MNTRRTAGPRFPRGHAPRFLLAFVTLSSLALACERSEPERKPAPSPESSAKQPAPTPTPPPDNSTSKALRYTQVPILGPASLRSLQDSLGAGRFLDVLKVNRLDLAHVRQGDSLVVPESWGDSLYLSPFPRRLPAADSLRKLLLVSIRVQAFGAYEAGQLRRWGPTSTGREDAPTPLGLYHANWKDKERISTVNEEWELRWVVNLDNFQGVSLHQYELPGRPASHSCVRLLEEDAEWIYWWAEQWKLSADGRNILKPGTPVLIFGAWAFGAKPRWKDLPRNPEAASVPLPEIESAFQTWMGGASPPESTQVRAGPQ